MGIDSISSKLLKLVGFLAVRLYLAKLWLKTTLNGTDVP